MKKIGEGWQYEVYDLENGRVFKKFKSLPKRTSIVLRRLFPYTRYPLWEIPTYIKNIRQKAIHSFHVLENNKFPPEWFANPRRLNGLDYEQDKGVPLHHLFATSSQKESKELVDQFIAFNQKLIENGIADKYFNIFSNFALNPRGDLVLTDIGELIDTREEIYVQIGRKIWSQPHIAGRIQDNELREYFLQEMDKNFYVI
jgi:hypothetical protein